MASPTNEAKLPPFQILSEPSLSFSPEDRAAVDIHPLRGLASLGPYSRHAVGQYLPELRVAMVGPENGREAVIRLMRLLQQHHAPNDRSGYVPSYPGFQKLFGLPFHAAPSSARVSWPDSLSDLPFEGNPETRLAKAFHDALSRLELVRDLFDVVIVHLPDAWGEALKSVSFDAHDTLKAIGATRGIPTQVLNDRTFVYSNSYPAHVGWRLAIALYVKAGGIPWKLAAMPTVPQGTAYIGLAYALRTAGEAVHYVTCCSQVFDMDGGGMQFVAFEARDPVADLREARRNPFLSRTDMRAVLARSLDIYRARNAGTLPSRLVVHKTTSFKQDELNGVCDAATSIPELECLEVGTHSHWRGVWMVADRSGKQKVTPGGYPVPRGLVQVSSQSSCLVWLAGNAPGVSTRGAGDYYQGGKSIPRPISLVRHAGKGPLELVALEALALTKMDWNNDALYDPVPVTIRYSQRLAKTIANVPDLPGKTYPYRLFM